MQSKLLQTLKFLIGWPLSLIALYVIFQLLLGKSNALTQIPHVNYFLCFLSIGCYVAFFFFRALFWQKLLEKKGEKFSFKQTAYIWGFSEITRFIPGNIWPILGRNSRYISLGSEKKVILTSIVQEAEFLVIASLLLSLLSLNFLLFTIFPEGWNSILAAFLVSTVVFSIVLLLFHKTLFTNKPQFVMHFFPKIPAWDSFVLLCVMTWAFFLFGLAQFFSVSAIFPLYAPHVLPLIGFFVFSFLVGFLVILAPMGLGIREGIITFGLTKYMPLSLAALAALFSRILQIFAELLFLVICLIWEKVVGGKKVTKKIERFCLTYKYEIALSIAVGIYIAYFTLASFLRYDNFFTGRFDLGNMDQTIWNTIHGRIFQVTDANGTNIVSRLAFHADFILIILSPLYLIWQDPRTLLFIQSLFLGIGGVFVYAIAQKILQKKSISLAFAISYLIYPAVNHANLYDFHAVTLAVPLFLLSWLLILHKKYLWSLIPLILAGLTKEEVWIITGLMGLYLACIKRQYVIGVSFAAASFGMFYYLFWHAIPSALGGQHFALSYYGDFGATPGGILKNIIFSPIKSISKILGDGQFVYILELFSPVIFLAFLAPLYLLFILPELGIDLLSSNTQLHMINYHYASIFTPFIFLASIYGLLFLQRKFSHIRQFVVLLILIPAFVCAYLFGPLPGAMRMNADMFIEQLPYASLVDNFLQSIPKRYSVAATNNVGSHLSHRQKIYTIPIGLKQADIVVFLLNDDFAQPSLQAQKDMAIQLDKDPQYVKLISYKDFVVYKKKSVPTYYKRKSNSILPLFKGN